MKTFIIVKSDSTNLYHVYNGFGERVAIRPSIMEVNNYLNEVFCPSSCTSYTFQHTAAPGTFIVTMK